jgi:uncharacterized protein (UPF0332 family)
MEKIRSVDRSQSAEYMKRAEECLASMQRDFEERRWDSCVILAIHAAISAADALCVRTLGKRSASENHRDAIILFQGIDPRDNDLRKAAMRLGDLLKIKTDAEYGERSQSEKDAELAKLNAERLVSFVKKRLSHSTVTP